MRVRVYVSVSECMYVCLCFVRPVICKGRGVGSIQPIEM